MDSQERSFCDCETRAWRTDGSCVFCGHNPDSPESPLLPFCEECGHDVGLPHSDSCGATGIVYPQPELQEKKVTLGDVRRALGRPSVPPKKPQSPLSDNPYPEWHGMHTAWNQGWDAAMKAWPR